MARDASGPHHDAGHAHRPAAPHRRRARRRALPIGAVDQRLHPAGAQRGPAGVEKTEVWIFADRDHLYIGVRCHDSQASRIVANDMRRDGRNIGQNDNLSIVIDSFYDRRNGYEFLVNAVGGMADAQITDERDVNRDWNTVWQYRAKRDAGGWTAEMAFPFRSLRYRPGATQVWGLNIRRTIRWKNEFVYLSPVPRTQGVRGILKLSSAGTLVGLEAPPKVLNLDIKPYALGAAKADRAVDPTLRGRSGRRRRRGREVRHHARADGGLHLSHRLRAGRRRRPAGQPHALQPVLPREARVLPGGPGHLRVWRRRDGAARRHVTRPGEHARALLQPADRPAGQRAGAHRGRRPDDGQGRPLQRGPAEHPDRRRARHRRGCPPTSASCA